MKKLIYRISNINFGTNDQNKKRNSLKHLILEGMRRGRLWCMTINESCKKDIYFHNIINIPVLINENWSYDYFEDIKDKPKLPSFDRKIINFYLNWEMHKEEIQKQYNLPNPYEPFIMIYERGGVAIVEHPNYYSVCGIITLPKNKMEIELLKGEEIKLDHIWLDELDKK